MSLVFDAETPLGTRSIGACFEAKDGEVTALFGRSGSGKTSILDMIAGLLRPARGGIRLDGEALFDAARGVNLPPERRRIGYVFQDARLFPHLSVRGNLAYGARRAPAPTRQRDFARIVALLGLEALVDRRPGRLSGGERQRVAIGRALLSDPAVLMLDEPLSALDAERKAEIVPYLERLRDEVRLPILYVSHQHGEIARLADMLVVMDAGRMIAAGPLAAVINRHDLIPGARRVATTVLVGRIHAHEPDRRLSRVEIAGGLVLQLPTIARPIGAPVRIAIDGRDVAVALDAPGRVSIANVLPATVREIVPIDGALIDLRLDIGHALWARITVASCERLGLVPGASVHALVKAAAIDRVDHSLSDSG
jgi:molybdate transport system ATP-binding protein